ncbi:MAG: acyltransferase domain-containing protein, partial [Spirillospora sp.]
AQPALGIAGLAVHRLLTAVGVHPDLAAGHSYGELVALCAAGVFDDAAMIGLSAVRAEAILSAAGEDPGAMAAVTGSLRDVRAALSGLSEIVVANHNAPRQAVISGTSAGIERALPVLSGAGLAAERLAVACAFHSPLVAAASADLRADLLRRDLRSPAFPVWANTTAAPYDADPAELAATLAGQLAAPVRFVEQIEAMYDAGARTFVEAGPGRVLTGLVGAILGDRPHTAVSCDAPGENSLTQLLRALAELAAAGVPVDPLPLFAGRDARPLSAAPGVPGWVVNGHLVRTADGGYPVGALRPAERVPGIRPRGAQDAVLEYLRTGREMIAAQREVILRHLGATAPPLPEAPVPAEPVPVPSPRPETVPDAAPLDVRATVVAVISARTGYPETMLDASLNLEADLSIDSIKRTVILGELTDRLGLAAPERLADVTTIGDIVTSLHARLEGAAPRPVVPPQAGPADEDKEAALVPAGAPAPADVPEAPKRDEPGDRQVRTSAGDGDAPRPGEIVRQVLRVVELDALPAPPESGAVFAGRRFQIVDDGCGIALELADMLDRLGAQVRTPHEADGSCDGLIHLAALRPGATGVLPGAYD